MFNRSGDALHCPALPANDPETFRSALQSLPVAAISALGSLHAEYGAICLLRFFVNQAEIGCVKHVRFQNQACFVLLRNTRRVGYLYALGAVRQKNQVFFRSISET